MHSLFAQMALSTSKVTSVLLSAIKKNTNTNTTHLGIHASRYLCIRENFVTMRGVIMRNTDSLASSMRDILNTWLSEHRTAVFGDREVGIRPGLCGLALSSMNDPVCGSDYPTVGSRIPPSTLENTASNTQSDSFSTLPMQIESSRVSMVSLCAFSGGWIIAVIILYRWRKRRSQRCERVGLEHRRNY